MPENGDMHERYLNMEISHDAEHHQNKESSGTAKYSPVDYFLRWTKPFYLYATTIGLIHSLNICKNIYKHFMSTKCLVEKRKVF